jgi:hypothetical protein
MAQSGAFSLCRHRALFERAAKVLALETGELQT